MTEKEILAQRFEANRSRLRAVALRMLGSSSEADDAVQETFLRLMRADASDIGNFAGWLTTIVARVSLDMLRARKSRHEVPVDGETENLAAADDAERETLIADSVGVAMLVVLETLTPAERVAFVLHDIFNVPFDDVAIVVGRSPAAARQLASRGRRRVQGAPAEAEADQARQRKVVGAFLAASRSGDFSALLEILDPQIVLRADAAAVAANAASAARDAPELAPEMRGLERVAKTFQNRLRAAVAADLDGYAGLAFVHSGQPRVVIDFVVENGRITEISMIGDPERIAAFTLTF